MGDKIDILFAAVVSLLESKLVGITKDSSLRFVTDCEWISGWLSSANFEDRFGNLRAYKVPFRLRDLDPQNMRRLVIGVESTDRTITK